MFILTAELLGCFSSSYPSYAILNPRGTLYFPKSQPELKYCLPHGNKSIDSLCLRFTKPNSELTKQINYGVVIHIIKGFTTGCF